MTQKETHMDPQEAVNAALNAGQGDAVQAVLEAAAAKTQEAYRALKANNDISDDYRQTLAEHTYQENIVAVAEKLTALAATATRNDKDDAERVFGTKGLPGDIASLSISRRDAADRVAQAENSRDLATLLTRATRSGDEVLARAIVERAVDIGDANIVNQFTADRPNLHDATERLWARAGQGRDIGRNLVVGGLLAAMRP